MGSQFLPGPGQLFILSALNGNFTLETWATVTQTKARSILHSLVYIVHVYVHNSSTKTGHMLITIVYVYIRNRSSKHSCVVKQTCGGYNYIAVNPALRHPPFSTRLH